MKKFNFSINEKVIALRAYAVVQVETITSIRTLQTKDTQEVSYGTTNKGIESSDTVLHLPRNEYRTLLEIKRHLKDWSEYNTIKN